MVNFLAIAIAGSCGAVIYSVLSFVEDRLLTSNLKAALYPYAAEDANIFPIYKKIKKFFRFKDKLKKRKVFPDFLDLLALALSAGLSLEHAWDAALDHLPVGPLSNDLSVVRKSLQLGRPREEAFKELAELLNDSTLKMALALIEQAMKRGNMIQDVLHDQARAFRQRQFLEMEKEAQSASLRLLFPVFVFILPAVFLVLLGPLLIQLSNGMQLF